jgi:hypothetical protein
VVHGSQPFALASDLEALKMKLSRLETRLFSETKSAASPRVVPPAKASDTQSEVHDSDTEDAALVLEELALGKSHCGSAPHMVGDLWLSRCSFCPSYSLIGDSRVASPPGACFSNKEFSLRVFLDPRHQKTQFYSARSRDVLIASSSDQARNEPTFPA